MERAFVLVAVGAAVAVVVTVARWWAVSRLRALRAEAGAEHWQVLGERPDGRPVVVAFSTRGCAECRVQDRVLDSLSGVRVLHFDAHDRGDLASRFGVLTVPATIVLRPDGRVLAMNHGLADAGRLTRQLADGREDEAEQKAG